MNQLIVYMMILILMVMIMKIKLNKNEVSNSLNQFNDINVKVKKEIDNIRLAIDELNNIWLGIDKDLFEKNINDFILKLNEYYKTKEELRILLAKFFNVYVEQDSNFKNQMKKENDYNERESQNINI